MKKYVVMVNYGLEGWKIAEQTSRFDRAVRVREEQMSLGNSEVAIFTPVGVGVTEVPGYAQEGADAT